MKDNLIYIRYYDFMFGNKDRMFYYSESSNSIVENITPNSSLQLWL